MFLVDAVYLIFVYISCCIFCRQTNILNAILTHHQSKIVTSEHSVQLIFFFLYRMANVYYVARTWPCLGHVREIQIKTKQQKLNLAVMEWKTTITSNIASFMLSRSLLSNGTMFCYNIQSSGLQPVVRSGNICGPQKICFFLFCF